MTIKQIVCLLNKTKNQIKNFLCLLFLTSTKQAQTRSEFLKNAMQTRSEFLKFRKSMLKNGIDEYGIKLFI